MEDLGAKIEVLVFPKLLMQNESVWINDKLIAVDGFVSFKDGSPKILAEEVFEIDEKTILPPFVPREQKRRNFGQYGQNGGSKYSSNEVRGSHPSSSNNITYKKLENLEITVPAGAGREILMEVKEILTTHAGESKVTIKIPNGETHKEIAIKDKVEISPIILRKLKELVGKDNVVCI